MATAALIVAIVAALLAAWSAWSAHRSAVSASASVDEARRARLDHLGPSVSIVGAIGRHERWVEQPSPGRTPAVTPPGVEYVLPRQDDELLLIGAEVLIVNDGPTSATVHIVGRAEFEEAVGGFGSHFDPGQNAPLPQDLGGGRYVLRAGAKALLLIRDGKRVRSWTDSSEDVVRVQLTASTQHSDVEDEWSIELQGPVLEPVHGDASRWRIAAHTPVRASVVPLGRRYPSLRRHPPMAH